MLGRTQRRAEILTLQNWTKGIAAQWPTEDGGGVSSEVWNHLLYLSFWFASSPSSNSNQADSSYHPFAGEEQKGGGYTTFQLMWDMYSDRANDFID